MTIESQIRIDLAQNGIPPIVSVMQFDTNTRVVKVSLFANGVPFVPEDCTVSVAYKKPDGTSGWYDKLPDESEAVSVADNVVTAILAPQVLTAPGNVCAAIRLDAAPNRISSFPFIVSVTEDPGSAAQESEDYYMVTNWTQLNNRLDLIQGMVIPLDFWAVRYTDQDVSDQLKATARKNIGAISADEVKTMLEGAGGGNANIDDTAVGAAAWSSRNIVDKLCPGFSESGAVVSCEPVEGYPLSVVSAIEAVQEGSGYPRPVTSIDVSTRGTTLIPGDGYGVVTGGTDLTEGKRYKLAVNAKNASGERVKLEAAEVYDKNGTYIYTITTGVGDYDVEFSMDLDPENTSGRVQADIRLYFAEEVDDSSLWQYDEGGDRSLVEGAYILSEYDPGNVRPITGFDAVQLTHGNIEGSSALTAVLGQTVGKGTYDWSTGELKITHALIRLTSDMKWVMTGASNPNGIRSFYVDKDMDNVKGSAPKVVSSHYRFHENGWSINSVTYENAIKILNSRIYLTDARFTDLASFKAFLEQETAQLMYPLAEPVTYQLDPQEILALSGENTLTSDTGDTQVSGKADPSAIIADLYAKINALQTAAVNNA